MTRHRSLADLARAWARYPILWSPKLSPDGRHIAWSWSGLTDAPQIWIAPSDASAPPHRLTESADPFFVRSFLGNGDLVLAQSRDFDEHDRLFRLSPKPGAQPIPLTPEQRDHYVFGGSPHPDGRHLLFTADYDHRAERAAPGNCVYARDLETGETRILACAQSVDDKGAEASPDGRFILYHRSDRHPAGCQPWVVAMTGTGDREILNFGDNRKCRAQWLGRGYDIVFLAESESHERIGLFDLDAGKIDWLIDDPGRSIEAIIPGADGASLAAIDYREGRLCASLLRLADKREIPFLAEGTSLLPIAGLADGTWIAERYAARAPHDLIRYDPERGVLHNLTGSLEKIGEIGLALSDFRPAQDFRWQASDGQTIQGWLYEPASPSRGLIVWVHGGPTWHSEDWVNPVIQFLIGAGFTVLDPNYRGSTGFGLPFREAIKREGWGGAEQDDIRSGMLALIAAGKAQRGRIGIAGLSYGGYSSWCAITKSADLVAAAMPICGMYELGIDYHATEMPHGRAYSIEMMGGTPEEKPERYFAASPRNFISGIKGRLTIVHGLADSNVSPENTRLACRDLDAAGIPYRLLTFPDEGHGIYRAGNRAIWLEAMADFFGAAFAAG